MAVGMAAEEEWVSVFPCAVPVWGKQNASVYSYR